MDNFILLTVHALYEITSRSGFQTNWLYNGQKIERKNQDDINVDMAMKIFNNLKKTNETSLFEKTEDKLKDFINTLKLTEN